MLKLRFFAILAGLALLPTLVLANEKFTIIHLNDTHGQIEPLKTRSGATYGGFARIAYLVDSLRKSAKASGSTLYFLHAGDATQGTPLSNITGGMLDMELLSDMGLTAMCLGNHEFDFGTANLDSAMAVAKFPMLSANIVDASGRRPYKAFIEEKAGAQRVLIVGMTTEYAGISTSPDNVRGLSFLPADSVLKVLLDSLKYGDKDLIIALSHRGWEADSALASSEPRVDVIVGGHTHAILDEPTRVGNALIVQVGAKGVILGKLDLDVKKGKVVSCSGEQLEVSDSTPSDPKMAALIAAASAELEKKIGGRIGSTEIALVRGIGVDSAGTRSLGDFLAELMRKETNADVAFTNQGGVRADILPGDVSMKDVLTAIPFQNTIVTMELSGAELEKVLDYNVSLRGQAGGSLHLAGVTYTPVFLSSAEYDPGDGKASGIKINGVTLDSAKTYHIATNNFLAAGGDGYEMLKLAKNIYDTGTLDNVILTNYIKKVGTIK
jgi:5'-nucleotidase/UDP-sugar diphosphatase